MLVSRGVLCWLWAGMGRGGDRPVLWAGAPWALPPQDGAFSPGVLCMCFEDHFCIVRSEEKNILTW